MFASFPALWFIVCSGVGAGALVPLSTAAMTEAPPMDAELTGMGVLPFVWYSGAVPDLELFGDGVPLETDEVASAPDVRCRIRAHPAPSDSIASDVAPSSPTRFTLFPAAPTRKSPRRCLRVTHHAYLLATGW